MQCGCIRRFVKCWLNVAVRVWCAALSRLCAWACVAAALCVIRLRLCVCVWGGVVCVWCVAVSAINSTLPRHIIEAIALDGMPRLPAAPVCCAAIPAAVGLRLCHISALCVKGGYFPHSQGLFSSPGSQVALPPTPYFLYLNRLIFTLSQANRIRSFYTRQNSIKCPRKHGLALLIFGFQRQNPMKSEACFKCIDC